MKIVPASILHPIRRSLTRFARDESGVALVEFAITLPMMLLVFAVIVEGSRLMLAFQGAISGVRDATRYMSRIVAVNICESGGSISGYSTELRTSLESILPTSVTVNSVTPSYTCVSGAYRVSPAPVVQVSAQITISYPFAGVFGLIGGSLSGVTTTITDRSRIFGT